MNIIAKYALLYNILTLLLIQGMVFCQSARAQQPGRHASEYLDNYSVVWDSQSDHSGQSMPCGGGDTGLNVWVEKGELLFYMSRSGTFDENNVFPKLGRVRVKLTPNPFSEGAVFRQELKLREGFVEITGERGDHQATIRVWVDVFRPVIHVDISSSQPVTAQANYESWRTGDRVLKEGEKFASSFKWAGRKVVSYKDEVEFKGTDVVFYHRNRDTTIFDLTVTQQSLDSVKAQLLNPLKNLTFGGLMRGRGMAPAGTATGTYVNTDFTSWKLRSTSPRRSHTITIFLHSGQATSMQDWQDGLEKTIKGAKSAESGAFRKTRRWWKEYWERSHIFIHPDAGKGPWQAARNYQLFRYMLGCNAYGKYPTKFNGGLFTADPVFVAEKYPYTPDFRNWGGGTFTAQNQRLVYWPMLKSGDFDMMAPQFDFYLRLLGNAEARTLHYWGHKGASFTEQIENFGLPNYAEYGLDRPEGYDPGLQHNAWLEYHWDTVLDFCLMILEVQRYTGSEITRYLPLIESCLTFFDEHYRYLAANRGARTLDENGHLVLYPGTAAETYKMAYNATSTIAGLKTVLTRLLELPDSYGTRQQRILWEEMLQRVPPLSFREMQGHKTIAPAKVWERRQNTEIPQLYPVFPFGMYGIGKPDLELAINTWKYDTEAIANRNHISWHQDNIFCARLGLTKEAAAITLKKLQDSGRRFPAFWGPGHDWVPDHNWGGTGMIGLQEMLLQAHREKIFLFPAWPKAWDVDFKLHAPYNTTVEGTLENGKLVRLKVSPLAREKDIILSELK